MDITSFASNPIACRTQTRAWRALAGLLNARITGVDLRRVDAFVIPEPLAELLPRSAQVRHDFRHFALGFTIRPRTIA